MPVYLLHGFRWPRAGFTGIRVHIIIHNLDDCSAEYIQSPRSQAELLKSFRNAFPDIMKELEPSSLGGDGKGIQFLEQYDPEDENGENAVSQPHAFVGDRVVMIAGGPANTTSGAMGVAMAVFPPPTAASTEAPGQHQSPAETKRSSKGSVSAGIAAAVAAKTQALSLNVEEVVAEGPGTTASAWEAFAELRDKIAPGEKIGWWVVYNGDPERAYDSDDEEDEEEEEEDEEEEIEYGQQIDIITEDAEEEEEDTPTSTPTAQKPPAPPSTLVERIRPPQPTPKPRMFEQSDPIRGNPHPSSSAAVKSPLRSPTAKGSGKRQPGMKAPQPPPAPSKSPLLRPQRQERQEQQPRSRGEESQAQKPKVAPKSESLKKKLFGKKS